MPTADELYKQADQLKEQGKFPEAIDLLVKLLEQDDQHALAHLTLAVLCGKIGRHEEAIEYALRACELEPEDPFSFTALSVTYQRAWQGTQNHEFIRRAEEAMARAQMLESRPR